MTKKQYPKLQELHERFTDKGFTVLGFPCNQFARQEPWDHSEIERFAQSEFGVTFPIYGKVKVNGKRKDDLYAFIKASAPGVFGTKSVKWNFTKFLIGRDGIPFKRYSPATCPSKLSADIERLLAADVTPELSAAERREQQCDEGEGEEAPEAAEAIQEEQAEGKGAAAGDLEGGAKEQETSSGGIGSSGGGSSGGSADRK